MDWTNLVQEIFQLCVIPLMGVLTSYLVVFIKNKTKQVTDSTNSALADKYINMLSDTVTTCVLATSQTYVNSLKQANAFDAEAQKVALNMTIDTVKAILSDEAKVYLTAAYGDLNALITQKIEAEINLRK
jgi:hypothetical protein